MAFELIPLNPEQHTLTFVPKLSNELPFFNLTARKKDIPKVIKYHGRDAAGRPINWEVYQDTSKEMALLRSKPMRSGICSLSRLSTASDYQMAAFQKSSREGALEVACARLAGLSVVTKAASLSKRLLKFPLRAVWQIFGCRPANTTKKEKRDSYKSKAGSRA